MSRSRNSKSGEVLRKSHPYKRPKHSQLLKQFEVQYIAINKDPSIYL